MDNFDDPIADLLSEGSNDSFFEDPKVLAKKSTPKKISKPVAGDVFRFDTQSKESANKKDDWLGLTSDTDIKPEQISNLQTKKVESRLDFKKDDVNDLLSLNTADSKTTVSKKSSILSEILGEAKKEEPKISFDDILQSSKLVKKETLEKKPVPNVIQNENAPPLVVLREPRRGRRNSSTLIDPLGIFETQKKEPAKNETPAQPSASDTMSKLVITKSSTDDIKPSGSKSSDLPNWLSGKESIQLEEKKVVQEDSTERDVISKGEAITPEPVKIVSTAPDAVLETLLKQQKISSSQAQLQNASIALQQQESQLMIAVQLKKYEENVMQMQQKQQEIVMRQEQQFNMLLEQQLAKQKLMENNMRVQQERISNHIELLMSQTSSVPIVAHQEKNEYMKNVFEDHRKFYDDIITSLKQKHHEEIFLMEESYKKQIHFLEESMEATENRLKTEIDNINKHFINKLEDMKNEKEELITKYEDQMKRINEINLTDLQVLKENCKTTVEDVRNEYKLIVDDMLQSKINKDTIHAESEMITKKIDDNLETLNSNTKAISDMQLRLSSEKKLLMDVEKESLNAKDTEVKLMMTSLEKQRVANDNERAQLLSLIRALETRLVEQTQGAREERWALEQATTLLSARSLALEREAQYVRKNLELERDQVKTLKQTLLSEHDNIVLKLTEEKLALAAERSRLETSVKLAQNVDASTLKVEVEAALKTAKEATELTDKERESLCKKQCEMELLRRSLQDREVKLKGKEDNLERLLKEADIKYREGEKALSEAKILEEKYAERLKEIQKQLATLASREKKLAEDKIALSKERLSIHNQMVDNKKCSLCEVDKFNIQNHHQHDSIKWSADAEIRRLKYDLENDNVVSKEFSPSE